MARPQGANDFMRRPPNDLAAPSAPEKPGEVMSKAGVRQALPAWASEGHVAPHSTAKSCSVTGVLGWMPRRRSQSPETPLASA